MSRRNPPTPDEQAQARSRLIISLYSHGVPWVQAMDQVDSILDRETWPDQDPDYSDPDHPYLPNLQPYLTYPHSTAT